MILKDTNHLYGELAVKRVYGPKLLTISSATIF